MESLEHFCDNRGDQNTSYIEIWKKIKKEKTLYIKYKVHRYKIMFNKDQKSKKIIPKCAFIHQQNISFVNIYVFKRRVVSNCRD